MWGRGTYAHEMFPEGGGAAPGQRARGPCRTMREEEELGDDDAEEAREVKGRRSVIE